MKISIIGYKNHALRLKGIIQKLGHKSISMFNHNEDDINELSASDVYIIASPNETHVEWIETIRSFGQDKYIFCEKPPATSHEDLQKIKEYDPRIYFNFNYRNTKFSDLVLSNINNGSLGKIIYASFFSSHGLAFKETFIKDWRFSGKSLSSSIIGNVGIHYIDLINYLFGNLKTAHISNRNVASEELPDTSLISIESEICSSTVFISYAAPFRNEAMAVFDNGIIRLLNGIITIQTPRDHFDQSDRFCPSEDEIIEPRFIDSRSYYDDSLSESVSHFIETAKDSGAFPYKCYEKSISSNKVILDLISDLNNEE